MERKPQMQLDYLKKFSEQYVKKTQKSKEWTQKYRGPLVDSRACAGFRSAIKEMLYPIVGVSGEGAYFFDLDGNKYVDITMGYGTLLFGHNYLPIKEALRDQLEKGTQLGPQASKAGEVAELISEITGVERVAFCNSGTEAIMAAIRLARLKTKRNKIVVFENSYHGFYDGTLVVSAGELGQSKPMFQGLPQSLAEDIVLLPYDSPQSIDYINKYKESIAGVLIEPVRSRFPECQPAAFLKSLKEVTHAIGAALIVDEVLTGFRCHLKGAQHYFGIEGDLVTYGKIIGGGLPIGIIAGKKEYMDGIDGGYWSYGDESYPRAPMTYMGGTYLKNPLTIAAAFAVIHELKREGPYLQETLNKVTEQFAQEINHYCEVNGLPLQVVCFSSLFRFKVHGNTDLFYYHLNEKGVYIWEGRNCFFSKAHSVEDINFVKNAVFQSLKDLQFS